MRFVWVMLSHMDAILHRVDIPRLSGLLHHPRHLLHQHLCRRVLSIHLPVRLCNLARLGNENAEIRSHARVDKADVGTYGCDLFEDRGVEEQRRSFLFGRYDDTVGS